MADDTSIYGVNDSGEACMRVSENVTSNDPTSIYGVNENGEACVRVMGSGGGGGGDQHNLGWYATQSALEEAYPTAEAGDYAIVGSTDTVWVWDSDGTGWKDTGAAGIELPDQTGHTGEFLITNGSSPSWGTTINGTYKSVITLSSYTEIFKATDSSNKSKFVISYSSTAFSGSIVFRDSDANYKSGLSFNNNGSVKRITPIGLDWELGVSNNKWKNIYVEKINNGADITVPNRTGTMVVVDSTSATAGQVLTLDNNLQPVWRASGGGSPTRNEVFLSPSDWNYDPGENGYLQVVNVSGVTSQSVVFVAPAPFQQEQQNYASAGVMCVQQGNGTLTFFSPNGSNDMLDVYVVVFN